MIEVDSQSENPMAISGFEFFLSSCDANGFA